MDRRGVLAIVSALFVASALQSARAEDLGNSVVYGLWTPPKMDAVVKLTPCGQKLCGDIIAHDYPGDNVDARNPSPPLQRRPIIGLRIFDMIPARGPGRWAGGVFYDPRTGKSYTAKVKLIDENRVKISGCIGPGLCKGYVWTRVISPKTALVVAN